MNYFLCRLNTMAKISDRAYEYADHITGDQSKYIITCECENYCDTY